MNCYNIIIIVAITYVYISPCKKEVILSGITCVLIPYTNAGEYNMCICHQHTCYTHGYIFLFAWYKHN